MKLLFIITALSISNRRSACLEWDGFTVIADVIMDTMDNFVRLTLMIIIIMIIMITIIMITIIMITIIIITIIIITIILIIEAEDL